MEPEREPMTTSRRSGGWLGKPYAYIEGNASRPAGPLGHLLGGLMALSHGPLTRWMIGQLGLQPADRILDIGCGSGMAIKLMSQRAPEGFLAGVDHSRAMIAQARWRNRDAIGRGRVVIRQGDVGALPWGEAEFDQVTAVETLYYWPDPLAGLREARRVLKPGGQLAVTLEMSKESARQASRVRRYLSGRYTEGAARRGQVIVSAAELEDMLRQAGFREVRSLSEPDRGLGWLCALARK